MSNAGFKGSIVDIETVLIAAHNGSPAVDVAVQFMDENGAVHATTRHVFSLNMEPETADALYTAVKTLMDVITQRVESKHFEAPDSAAPAPVLKGIIEALRDDKISDDLGPQG